MIDETPFFSKCHCGGVKHLVALSGAHTIGHAHERKVSKTCEDLMPGSTERAQNFDNTPFTFDNTYWKQLMRASCPKRRVFIKKADSCTRPFLTEDWVENKNWAEDTGNPLNNEETMWYVKEDGNKIRCSSLNSSNTATETCAVSRCGATGCNPPKYSNGCSCDPCGLDDVSHCTGASSCGSFHSDQMLWSGLLTTITYKLSGEGRDVLGGGGMKVITSQTGFLLIFKTDQSSIYIC